MTANRTSIINWALTKLGADRITNPGDASERAEAAAEIYDNLMAAELRRNVWKFAIRAASLGEELPAPAAPWERRFPLPADCLRLLTVGTDALGSQRWAIEGRHVVTRLEAPLAIRYITRTVVEAELDALFVEAFVAKLAAELAPRIRDDSATINGLKNDHQIAVREARRIGAIELPPIARTDGDPWVQSRIGGPWLPTEGGGIGGTW